MYIVKAMKLAQNWFGWTTREELESLDEFYSTIVRQLGMEARRQYCVNLIGRLRDDQKQVRCPKKLEQIRKFIRAANAEIRKLAR